MFKYDSTHGPFKGSIKVLDESSLEINGKKIIIMMRDVMNKRWVDDHNVD